MNRLLSWSNGSLLFCLLALVATVVMAYPLADMLPLPGQVAMHIGTLVFATGLKISYIARLASLKSLGLPVH
ncbi:hypothetical protein [Marinobacter sp.]|uniref:hypothetical protein n=1 Tax=Marinobacter sp. TaxID=50741 RepID=UPI00384CFE95